MDCRAIIVQCGAVVRWGFSIWRRISRSRRMARDIRGWPWLSYQVYDAWDQIQQIFRVINMCIHGGLILPPNNSISKPYWLILHQLVISGCIFTKYLLDLKWFCKMKICYSKEGKNLSILPYSHYMLVLHFAWPKHTSFAGKKISLFHTLKTKDKCFRSLLTILFDILTVF